MRCYHHQSQDAVKSCDSCGKPICQECSDVFRIEKGIHAGGRVCYDCASELVTTNMANIDRFKEDVKTERTKLIIGWAIGFVIGIMIAAGTHDPAGFIGIMVICIAVFAFKFIKRSSQISQCDAIIASDSNALRELRDYFAYTQVMEEKRGRIELEKLASQGGELFNNSYARTVANRGEAAAQAGLRQSVVTISANGEIIRSFGGSRR